MLADLVMTRLTVLRTVWSLSQTAAPSRTVSTPTPSAVSSTGSVLAGLVTTISVLLTSSGSRRRSCATGRTGWSVAPDLPVTSVRRDVPDLPHSVAVSTKDLDLISSTFLLSFYFPIKTLFHIGCFCIRSSLSRNDYNY